VLEQAIAGITLIVLVVSLCMEVYAIFSQPEHLHDLSHILHNILTIVIGLEFVLLLLVAAFTGIMLYYTFIAIGQLFRKNRVLAAVGAYFVYYIITQIISTVLTIGFSALTLSGTVEQIGLWAAAHPYQTIHIVMWGLIVLEAIFAAVEFLVIKWVITKKLNLE